MDFSLDNFITYFSGFKTLLNDLLPNIMKIKCYYNNILTLKYEESEKLRMALQ